MFKFQHIDYFWGFILVGLFILLFVLFWTWRNKKINVLGNNNILKKILPDSSITLRLIKFCLFITGFSLLIFGLANLQLGSSEEEVKREGIDIMIALDLSNSMMAEDLKPNRLENAKRAISKFIDNLHSDRLGIVVFGGQAYVQLPITTDYSAAKLFLSSVNTKMIPTQGTAIGTAVEKCMDAFDFENGSSKSIIIITDGENHEDNAIEAVKKAADKGVIVHAIGMGSSKGAPIPIIQRGRKTGYRQDNQGNTVVTKLNENMLKELASNGQGVYIRANNSRSGLNLILDEIENMEKTEFGSTVFIDYEDYFQWFLGPAFILFFLETLLIRKRISWLSSKNLFGE
jgi:Ca-activated chloride channel family protein